MPPMIDDPQVQADHKEDMIRTLLKLHVLRGGRVRITNKVVAVVEQIQR